MTQMPPEDREELQKLERKHGENPEGRYFVPLANAYRRAGDLTRAVTLLREGIEKHPDYLSAHIVLGRCLADSMEYDDAEAEFRHVLSLDPQNLIALRTLGELATTRGMMDEARLWYRELLAVDPMNEEARRALEAMHGSPQSEEAVARATAPDGYLVAENAGEDEGPVPDEDDVAASNVHEEMIETLSAEALAGRENDTPVIENDEGFDGTMIDHDGHSDGEPPAQHLHFEMSGDDEGEAQLATGDAVITETIAELYTRQGFYDRAIAIYQELIRRRGGDLGLEARIQEVEALAAGGAGAGAVEEDSAGHEEPHMALEAESESRGQVHQPAEAISPATSTEGIGTESTQDDPLPAYDEVDSFADSFSTGFPTLDQGSTIREFLVGLLDWRPSEPQGPEGAAADVVQSPSTDSEDGPDTGRVPPTGPELVAEDRLPAASHIEDEPGGGEEPMAVQPHDLIHSDEPRVASITDEWSEIGSGSRGPRSNEELDAGDEPVAEPITEPESRLGDEIASAKESIVDEPVEALDPYLAGDDPSAERAEGADAAILGTVDPIDLNEPEAATGGAAADDNRDGALDISFQGDSMEDPAEPSLQADLANDDLFPWEIPTTPPSTPKTEVEAAREPFPFEYAGEEESATESADDSGQAPWDPEVTAERETDQSDSPPEPSSAGDEDDDLESFQTWLRSLRR